MNIWKEFHGPNSGYILELYERYSENPDSVDPSTRALFDLWKPETDQQPQYIEQEELPDVQKIRGVVRLARSIRAYGHLAADIDPLGYERPGDPALEYSTHGVTEQDLARLPSSLIEGPIASKTTNALEAIEELKKVYLSKSGFDYDHIHKPEERLWLRGCTESGKYNVISIPIDPLALLNRLTEIDVFEKFLHRIFPGKFRFSIEGVDMLVPMLNEFIDEASKEGIRNILLGMAHRGRLNVLAHVLNKPYYHTFSVFKDPVHERDFRDDIGWRGDVKYHAGFSKAVNGNGKEIDMIISLAPNPSHLEAVNPVVEGMARAAGTVADSKGEPHFDPCSSIPVLVHGDSAFQGQGVVPETLNLSKLPGYSTGGTLHIITNNQLGYTTTPEDSRSTLYASDLAKGYEIPIIHVNADDPEACIQAVRLGFTYIRKFQKDFLIDLVGYRKHGHNEADEPSFTQPRMYKKIEKHPSVRELWAKKLVERNIIDENHAEDLFNKQMEKLHSIFESLEVDAAIQELKQKLPPPSRSGEVNTSVDKQKLISYHKELVKFPDNFNLHSKLKRPVKKRAEALNDHDEKSIDWALAEDLAFASILADGTPIRFTGQDTERGTFSHRHSVFHDFETGDTHIPLQSIKQATASFEIKNSPLTENACIGFEYGYNIQSRDRLVIWEAQYGDFINGAQTMIDEFIVSARAKWGLTPSLVLMLPHGYEGQGPDHCSGRLERFLGLAADANIRIANCSSSGQFFHLLRRQALLLLEDPLPLVIMTPKSLLRNPASFSSLNDLSEGTWQNVIDDPRVKDKSKVKRLIFCSGKIYLDLDASDLRNKSSNIAIVRIEQLYPFPKKEIKEIIPTYKNIKEIVWVQEEPSNMGSVMFLWPRFKQVFDESKIEMHYIGRKPNSSPSEGSSSWHKVIQEAIIKETFNLKSKKDTKGILWYSLETVN
ncbi:MAG: 2-oxoglutarate dehydrogenase E1 component [Candidatus Dadabacteria bacterium]|nr:2-oxoglutarate dehydrogenase E1 component [Candidatus Dadabacteria bacterium]NIS07294.1 2-oxoglutarate dehydrogenase E1 component [Candidatus Dadabacteria bacterium]NIY21569.1 2-oxoglutarate dehydrogenase E1 component [Candidatus Dadabacteria bacterium]